MTGKQEDIIVELLKKILYELNHKRTKFKGPIRIKK